MRNDWDAIVVGLGAIGSGAAYWLSRRLGDRVLGLEQFELGHSRGAGQDHSRIIRLSYHHADYVRLARRAYATWAEVEAESGTRIVTTTGGLDIAPRVAAIPLSDYMQAMTAESVPYEHLDGPAIMARWPQWRLGDEHHGLYQADAGIADPNRANAAHQRLARAHGATLLEHSPVTRLRDAGGGVEVTTADGTTHRAANVVVADIDRRPHAIRVGRLGNIADRVDSQFGQSSRRFWSDSPQHFGWKWSQKCDFFPKRNNRQGIRWFYFPFCFYLAQRQAFANLCRNFCDHLIRGESDGAGEL